MSRPEAGRRCRKPSLSVRDAEVPTRRSDRGGRGCREDDKRIPSFGFVYNLRIYNRGKQAQG